MSNLTAEHLNAIMPNAPEGDIEDEIGYCIKTAVAYDIRTKPRFAAWIANVAKESGELYYLEEIADGWDYEWRTDLGNIYAGDGPRFKGHGYIQITGRYNHRVVGQALGVDAEANPLVLTEIPKAWLSAGYYWRYMSSWGDLNIYADEYDFESTVLGVRGGADPDRRHYYDTALSILPDDLWIVEDATPDPVTPEEWPTVEAKVSKGGYLYIEDDWLKLPSLLNGALKTDAEGWIYVPGATPTPEPVRWAWPANLSSVVSGGTWLQQHPTRYDTVWRDDVEEIARRIVDKYAGQVWANTYVDHPEGWARDADSVDFWAYTGRGYAIDYAIGQAVFDELFNDPAKPDIDWCIWQGWLWSVRGGWEWWGDHYDHCHITYL